jgi:hypothetical protein
LGSRYSNDTRIDGIVYLHDITHKRMFLASQKTLAMFEKLCGAGAASRVVLVTTMWKDVETTVGLTHEQQLSEQYWRQMLDRGSRLERFGDTRDSAWSIITSLVQA